MIAQRMLLYSSMNAGTSFSQMDRILYFSYRTLLKPQNYCTLGRVIIEVL